ncbi:circadian clock-controlled protein daywake-like [Pararge aegeria]|uniref:circadian clock-controlled protein daywake-like n=1 Tax=Pararge aegeria TaxID=116150 RepID=UPI0019D16128|nr:circadian clock-controlled protein daywake-like [Pararge aegeria]
MIPDPITHEKCSLQDAACIKKQAQLALPSFTEGVPELEIQSFNKMHIKDIVFESTDMNYELRNIEIGGFNDTIIDDISINMPFKLMRLSFHTTLKVDCDYKLDGLLFGVPAFGEGKAYITLNNMKVEMILIFDIVKNEQGKDIMDIKTHIFGANAIGGVHTQLDNMFNGDKDKSKFFFLISLTAISGEIFHALINENWRPIIANFGRSFSPTIIKGIFEAIKTYMRSRPLEDLAL